MRKRYSFVIMLLLLLATMFKSGNVYAVDPPVSEYKAALAAIIDGAYYITTDVNGTKFYVTQGGSLTDDQELAYVFPISRIDASRAGDKLFDVAFKIEPCNGGHFSNTTLTDNKANLMYEEKVYRQESNSRDDWERQIFYLNAETGKYAIRSCNTAYGESSWADAGRVFWTWYIEDSGADYIVPTPCYTYDVAYIWTLEQTSFSEQYIPLTVLDGMLSRGQESVSHAEAYDKLVDENKYSKWGGWFDPSLSDEDSWPQNTSNSANKMYIIVKAEEAVVPTSYFLINGNDTGNYPGRNWASWKIYGGNFNNDEEAVRNGEGWTLIDSREDEPLPSENFGTIDINFNMSDGNTSYKYFWIEIEKTVANTDMYMQMSEWGLGTYDSFERYLLADGTWTDANGTAWYFTINRGNATITGRNFNIPSISGTIPAELTIPSIVYVGNTPYTVTSIGYHAFLECTGLTSITIPDGVTRIERSAFSGCTGLTSINIPENVTSIGSEAFYGCTGLTSITIPESVTSIGQNAFTECTGLTSVTINSQIVDSWFSSLTSIQEVTLGDNVTSIGLGAFWGCSGLKSITIPESVTSIGDWAFMGCYFLKESFINLSTLTSSNNWGAELCDELTNDGLFIKDGIVVKYTGTSTTITIPENVTSIGENAFSGCTGLTSITIPESVTSIGGFAFRGCNRLISITIPESVTSIGGNAFQGCSGLTSITIPESVTSIGYQAFQGCSGLTSITIPNSVTSIGGNAFEECTSLASITIPESVTSIGDYAFYNCIGLTSITIPENVTYIGDDAFMNCYFLTESFINLSTLTSSNNWGATLYDEITNDGLLIKDGIVVKYTGTSTTITIPEYVTCIGENAFYYCTSLTSITIPESVTSIGDWAFSACFGLTSINIPESVTSIGVGTFDGCSGLRSITIPESVTSIGGFAFWGCSGLKSINIPESVTSIGGNAFSGCGRLKSVTMPANNISFTDSYAFGYDNNIESVYISDLTKWLQTNFGKGNNPLRSGAKLYLNNEEVKNLVIPEGTTSINIAVFEGCESITSVSIPSSVTSIGSYAFADCPNLTSVKVGIKNPLAIDGYTFTNRTNATLYVPYGYVYDKADYWKEFKEIVEIMPGIASLSELSNNKLYMLTTEYYELQLSEGQGRLEWKDVALLSNPNHMGLVTDISQLSSPFTEPSEGSLEALLDNNTSTYWHSEWSGGEVPVHSHYLQVDLKESVDENIQLVFTRRIQANNDHITQWGVFGSNDPDAADDAWTELASLSTPFHNKYETILSDAFDTQGYRYLRFYIDKTTSQSLESGGFGHLSEFRLFKTSYFDEKPDAYKQFAILNINGKYYLYSPAVSAFYIMDTEFCPNSGSAFTIQDDLTGNDYRWTLTTSLDGQSLTLGTHVKIAPMADFNPTEALATFIDTNASTDISQLDNAIYIEPFTARVGEDVRMSINLKNAEAATAYVFDLVLPEGITVATNDKGKYIDELSDRHDDHTRTINFKGENTYSFSTLSGNSEELTGNDGPIRLVTLHVDDAVEEGVYPILIKNASYSKPNGALVVLAATKSSVTIEDYVLGDVNGNGGVDIGDAVSIVNYLVGKDSSNFVAKAADTNKNEQIDIGDAVTIVNLLVGKITSLTRELNINWDDKNPE